jgi:hypothetical protein
MARKASSEAGHQSCLTHVGTEGGQLVEQSTRVLGTTPTTICADSNYFCAGVLAEAHEQAVNFLCPPPEQSKRAKKAKKPTVFPKHQFKYDPQTDTYACPANEVLKPTFEGHDKASNQSYKSYATPACATCPLREQCTKAAHGRRIKRYESDELSDVMRAVMEQPRAKQAYSHRQGSVEPAFGELRHMQGLNRFHRTRLAGVSVEFSLHAMAHNVRRLLVAAAGTRRRAKGKDSANHPRLRSLSARHKRIWTHQEFIRVLRSTSVRIGSHMRAVDSHL